MKCFVPSDVCPLILDIGANVGQSTKRFKAAFPWSIVHSFEPSPEVFRSLAKNTSRENGVFLWNCALGEYAGKKILFENTSSGMSSFLPLGEKGWGSIEKESAVDVTTIDDFLAANQVEQVDILKSDTQGYELEVLKGAEQAILGNRIGLIHLELIFSPMYEALPPFDQLFRHLIDRNFLLVSIYGLQYQKRLADWADALFVNKEYSAKTTKC